MRTFFLYLLLIIAYCQFTSCHSPSAEKCFNVAILNCNTIHDFAGRGLFREMESPSVKMVNGDVNNLVAMKRKEMVEAKIETVATNYNKVKQLKEMEDTKEMLRASLALYEYVLPVYKQEYMELARLYDEGASEESVTSYIESIQDRYYSGFAGLYDQMVAAGKLYAGKHNIQVNWDVRTSPR
ncbi:MAG: hypothetical protein JNK14_15280 [Chitinophagaceae bacterium]|nr:hypothetical protein [Chitinophagaceae bacterium]